MEARTLSKIDLYGIKVVWLTYTHFLKTSFNLFESTLESNLYITLNRMIEPNSHNVLLINFNGNVCQIKIERKDTWH